MFFFETPSNPALELVDIAAVSKIARDNGILTIVDNVFATPMLQRPLALGADIVVYSATKHIDGQGRCLGGAVLGKTDFIAKYVQEWLRQTGPSISPFNAWVMLKGLETLPVRVKAQCATSAKIADYLVSPQRRDARPLSCPLRSPAGGTRGKADAGRRPDHLIRGRRW